MANPNSSNAGGIGLPEGAKIGKYEVCHKIGVGGQAIVYKCYDSLLDRYVAIKQISSALAESPKFIKRFRREAQILAKLGSDQPAIITVHDLIEDERGLFIVTELVDGHSIEASLVDSPAPGDPKAVLLIILRMAAALHDVHKAGIIHRDIKPSNILITEGLHPKIADFGVAGTVSGQTSMVLGTTKYMAPELFAGPKTIDGRADMYSLGMIAYEMLLGRGKFSEIFADIVRDPHSEPMRWMKWHTDMSVTAPDISSVLPELPQALSDIVAKMLAKDVDQRYPDMEALGRAIKQEFSPRGRPVADLRVEELVVSKAAPAKKPPALEAKLKPKLLQESAPTAQIPRRPLSLRAKLMLAGVVVVAIVIASGVLAYMNFQAVSKIRSAAQEIWTRAQDNYSNGQFSAAAAEYRKLQSERFDQTPHAQRASVLLHLADARQAVKDASSAETSTAASPMWERAGDDIDKARVVLAEVQAKTQSQKMLNWTRKMDSELKDFDESRVDNWTFYNGMRDARALLTEGLFREAITKIDELLALEDITLTGPQQTARNELRQQIISGEFRSGIGEHLTEAQRQIDKIKADPLGVQIPSERGAEYINDAKLQYDQAEQAIASAVEAHHVTDEDADQYRKDLIQARAVLASMLQYVGLIGQANAAETDTEKLAAFVEALAINESKALSERVAQLQYETALAEAMALKLQWDQDRAPDLAAAAVDAFNRALALRKDPEVEAELASLILLVDREGLIIAGDAALAGAEFDKAIILYMRAQQMTPDERIVTKITDARFGQSLAAGQDKLDQKLYTEAIEAYAQASQIKPEATAQIDELVQRVDMQKKVDAHIANGDQARTQKDYSGAIRLYRQAKRILAGAEESTAEVDTLIKQVSYERSIDKGKSAMQAGNYSLARAEFSHARKLFDTEMVRKLLDEVDRLEKSEG